MNTFYLTNAIAYVNGAPHIGHALEYIQGDAIARYHRSQGMQVRFLVGTDEHGQKVMEKAQELGMEPQALADENSAKFRAMFDLLGAGYDDYIRTTEARHKKGAQKLWKALDEAGLFYEKEYEGLYCKGCEAFILEKDLEEGLCPTHRSAPALVKEKNIFFALSRFTEQIRELVESGKMEIVPEARKKEFLSFMKEGLKDVSFSRPRAVLPWSIEVPGKEEQGMYVWCDALSNYVTALNYAEADASLYETFWPASVHVIGKDIIRFHCAYWPAMLLGAGLPTPKKIFVHGFVTSNGMKMSKSLGNVVDPMEMIEHYGVDAFRYYMLREIPSNEDGDFTIDRFETVYKDELQNTIGNLFRRSLTMALKQWSLVPMGPDAMVQEKIQSLKKDYHQAMKELHIQKAMTFMLELAWFGNAYIEEKKPWAMAKENDPNLDQVLSNLIAVLQEIASMLEPVMPETASKMKASLKEDALSLGEILFLPLDQLAKPASE